jgi:hypothetical protein
MKSKVSARMMNVQRLLRGGRFCGADGASVKSVPFCELFRITELVQYLEMTHGWVVVSFGRISPLTNTFK